MRVVFIGASEEAVLTAHALIKAKHDVVIVEADRSKIEKLSDELDCSFLHGDGGKPAVLREVNPKQTDVLLCLSDNDQANIIASLVARSLEFKRVITSIKDTELETICHELGLNHTIIPARTISRNLVDMVRGLDTVELSTILKQSARFFTFTVEKNDSGPVCDLKLPDRARVVFFYRDDKFSFVADDTKLREGDEVIILTHSDHIQELCERWNPKQANEDGD